MVNGDDYERAVFFSHMESLLNGYKITAFNPFYDESTDGIYIENLNTYILSDGGYNKLYPILPHIWEKEIKCSIDKFYPVDILRQVLIHRAKESKCYGEACVSLKKASLIKERLHGELSPYLNEDRIVSFVHKFFSHNMKKSSENGKGEIRLLSSPTSLGFHTHYDTIYNICDKTINIIDEAGFIGSIILSVIKNYALKQKFNIIGSPAYFNNNFFQFLMFPTEKLCLCISDNVHSLPFTANETIHASRFLTKPDILMNRKTEILLTVEKNILEKAIVQIYEGRDERFKSNHLTSGFSESEEAKNNAKKLAEKILN